MMDVLHWDGTLSAKHFRIGAFAFAQKWENRNLAFPPWLWLPCPKYPWLPPPEEESYLSLEKICIFRPNEEEDIDQISQIDTVEEVTCCLGKEDVLDDATLIKEQQKNKKPSYFQGLYKCGAHLIIQSI